MRSIPSPHGSSQVTLCGRLAAWSRLVSCPSSSGTKLPDRLTTHKRHREDVRCASVHVKRPRVDRKAIASGWARGGQGQTHCTMVHTCSRPLREHVLPVRHRLIDCLCQEVAFDCVFAQPVRFSAAEVTRAAG